MIEKAARTDRQLLQGKWRLASASVGGQAGNVQTEASVTVTGDGIVLEVTQRWEGTFTLDPAHSPRRINLRGSASDGGKAEEIRGVYGLRGDELYLCLASGEAARPGSLRSTSGTGEVSLVLRREGP